VWGRRFITEGVIKSVVAELRTALGDDAKQPRWIVTVPAWVIASSARCGVQRRPCRQPPPHSAANSRRRCRP
jgi:hypothetical protein